MLTNTLTDHHLLYICDDRRIPPGIDTLKNQLCEQVSVRLDRVSTIKQAFALVADYKHDIDAIIIDIDAICDDTSCAFDTINTLTTLLKYRNIRLHAQPADNALPAIAIGADTKTNPRKIREVLAMANISGIYPSGFEHSLSEKIIAVRALLDRQHHVPKAIKEVLATRPKMVGHDTSNALTTRQSQILELVITRGASNKTIANILHITDSTVKLHMTSILKKCGVRSRTQLVAFHTK